MIYEKRVSDIDVLKFAQVTGDFNPIHFFPHVAAKTRFREPVAHGMLTAGLISAALVQMADGKCIIYMGQELVFTAPVYINDMVRVEVEEVIRDGKVSTVRTDCYVGEKLVVRGTAKVLIEEFKERGAI